MGELTVDQHDIPLDFEEPTVTSRIDGLERRIYKRTTSAERTDGDVPLFVKIIDFGDSDTLAGYVTRKTPFHGKLGFALLPRRIPVEGDPREILGLDPEPSPRKLGYRNGVPIYDPITRVDEAPDESVLASSSQTPRSDEVCEPDDVGVLATASDSVAESWGKNQECDTDLGFSGTYRMVAFADCDPRQNQMPNEVVRNGSNQWHLQSYWPDRPEQDLVARPRELIGPLDVEFHAQAGPGDPDYESVDVRDAVPNDDQLARNEEFSDGFSIALGFDLLPIPFLSVGASVSYQYTPRTGSRFVPGFDFEDRKWEPSNYFYWSIELDGTSPNDFPRDATRENWGVKFDVQAQSVPGSREVVVPKSECTYYYRRYIRGSCPGPFTSNDVVSVLGGVGRLEPVAEFSVVE